jgi:AraC-like DNA-binding protein
MAYFFQFTTGNDVANISIYPDNCMKIFFEYSSKMPEITVMGINIDLTTISLKPNTNYLIFMPFSCLGVRFSVSPAEILNSQVNLKQILMPGDDHLYDQLRLASASVSDCFGEQVDQIGSMAGNFIKNSYSPILSELCSLAMCRSRGLMRLDSLESLTGYSERHCRGEFRKNFGYSPKRYNKIMRFQGAFREWYRNERFSGFAEFYCDQSHFIREFRNFTQKTPSELREYLLENGNRVLRADH